MTASAVALAVMHLVVCRPGVVPRS